MIEDCALNLKSETLCCVRVVPGHHLQANFASVNRLYAELPENEDLSMHLAATIGMEVPPHGLIRARGGSLTYFVKCFDREGRRRHPQEDFAQISGENRDTKYNSSMERLPG